MPAQKRQRDVPPEQDDSEGSQNHLEGEDGDESDGSTSSSGEGREKFVLVKLTEIRKEVQCPICLGIIRKTRTVMGCLHRFCRECIDKSMRLGNNECPACRTHCASRRSLRDDPNYDTLISILYPDIDKYLEEELAFQEEEKARNKQIQASIAETVQRQSEALGRKGTTARATAAAFVRRPQATNRNLRGRKNNQATELQGPDDDEEVNEKYGSKESSSEDERYMEVKPKRPRRRGTRLSQPSSAIASTDGGCDENDSEVHKELMGAAAGLVCSSERLVWGKGGVRSHNRHGNLTGGSGKQARNSRLSRLMNFLRNLEEANHELDIQLILVSLDEQRVPSLQQPYLCCRPTLSVRQLCQYVALQTSMPAEEIEMLFVKELHSKIDSSTSSNASLSKPVIVDPFRDELHILEEQETMEGLLAMYNFSQGHLLLAYRRKLSSSAS